MNFDRDWSISKKLHYVQGTQPISETMKSSGSITACKLVNVEEFKIPELNYVN